MTRRSQSVFIVTLAGAVTLVACSNELPVRPSHSPRLGGAGALAARAVPGSYELSFLARVDGVLQPVSTLPVGSQELILTAHVEDAAGTAAQRGRVVFEYCSLKGLPPSDITRPDEAPLEACDAGEATWAHLLSIEVNELGEASMNFGVVQIPRTVGFRFRYLGQGSGIASGVSTARNFTWVAAG
jgi:hypothetical protein